MNALHPIRSLSALAAATVILAGLPSEGRTASAVQQADSGTRLPMQNGTVRQRGSGAGSFMDLQPAPYKARKSPHVLHRRGLAVVADFANTRLEDWQGDGFNNTEEIASQLRQMSDHWAWLSRGKESFHWDIIRVTLPDPAGPTTYSSWWDYRNAVAAQIRRQVDVSRYDGNKDGIIDSAWIISSNVGMAYDYLIGGMSQHMGVNMFVDAQDSGSVIAGATGNYNHEVGHTLGLPDLYGPYQSLHYLTLMSDSWELPPADFTAYERSMLGWLVPDVLKRGSQNVRLSSRPDRMDALRINTSRPSEYFLIEYRRRPDSGYGSVAPPYNGLAIYHVLEGSSQQIDPPLVKLEAADGYIEPDGFPQLNDFLSPANPDMRMPLIVRSYFDGQEVFRIDNLYMSGQNAIGFHIQTAETPSPINNLLLNPSFETAQAGDPQAWAREAWQPTSDLAWDATVSRTGQSSASITSTSPNDSRWLQTVTNLIPGQAYQFCGWVRGENISTGADAPVGANLSLMGQDGRSEDLTGTFDWKQLCVTFRAQQSSATLACRMGFYGSTVTGKMWCDDMTVERLRSAFTQ